MATALGSRLETRLMDAEPRLKFQREASRVGGSLRKQAREARSALFGWSFAFRVSGTLFVLPTTLC